MLISECVCFTVQSVKLLGLKNILDWLIIQSSKRRTIKVMIHKKKNYDNNVGFFSFILFTAWSLCFCLHIQYLFVIGWELITTPEDRISNTWLEPCTVNCFFFLENHVFLHPLPAQITSHTLLLLFFRITLVSRLSSYCSNIRTKCFILSAHRFEPSKIYADRLIWTENKATTTSQIKCKKANN